MENRNLNKEHFDLSTLQFFENSCAHYNQLLNDSIELLKTQVKPQPIKVLELGVGTGGLTQKLFDNLSVSNFVGVDIKDSFTTICQKRFEDFENVTFVTADAVEYLNSTNEIFDLIASSFVIHNLPNDSKESLFRLIKSKLEPSGKLLLIDKIADDILDSGALLNAQLQQFKSYNELSSDDFTKEYQFWIEHYKRDELEPYRYTEQQLMNVLQQNNMTVAAQTERVLMDRGFVIENL